jgi:hypothetical protein
MEATLLWLWRSAYGCGELVEGSFRAIFRGFAGGAMWKTFVPRGTNNSPGLSFYIVILNAVKNPRISSLPVLPLSVPCLLFHVEH